MSAHKITGLVFSKGYKFVTRLKDKAFSLLISGAFAKFGRHSVLQCPIRLSGEERIEVGDGVFIGSNSWLQTLPDGENASPALYIGSGTSVAGGCVISAVRRVVLEENVLLARNVYISDHIHRYTDKQQPILSQGVDKVAPVLICRDAWLGQNVVVCSGVTIGMGSVIGANSVVNGDIPDRSVAVGTPAKVVRKIDQ
jgi:acetyltransferase-like isoleucine patch superfamily enzyme